MRARLGFAIATSVDPDILLLDEVLATGDANFRAKSKTRVIEIVAAAKAVVLVTHDMNWVTEYCNRAVLIEKGRDRRRGRAGRCRRAAPAPHRGSAGARHRGGAMRPGSTRGSSRSGDGPGGWCRRRRGQRAAEHAHQQADDRAERDGAAPVHQHPDIAVDLAGDDHPGKARPAERHPAGRQAPHGTLVDRDLAGEHRAHERLVDPCFTGQRQPDRAHVGRDRSARAIAMPPMLTATSLASTREMPPCRTSTLVASTRSMPPRVNDQVLGAGEVKPATFDAHLPGGRLARGHRRSRRRRCGGRRHLVGGAIEAAAAGFFGWAFRPAGGRRGRAATGLRRRCLRCGLAHGGRPRAGHLWLRWRCRAWQSSAGGSLSGRSVIAPSLARRTLERECRRPVRATSAILRGTYGPQTHRHTGSPDRV